MAQIESPNHYAQRFHLAEGAKLIELLGNQPYLALGIDGKDVTDEEVQEAWRLRRDYWLDRSLDLGLYFGAVIGELECARQRLASATTRSQYWMQREAECNQWQARIRVVLGHQELDSARVEAILALAAAAGFSPNEVSGLIQAAPETRKLEAAADTVVLPDNQVPDAEPTFFVAASPPIQPANVEAPSFSAPVNDNPFEFVPMTAVQSEAVKPVAPAADALAALLSAKAEPAQPPNLASLPPSAAGTPVAMSWSQKAAILQGIQGACWETLQMGNASVWKLSADFTRYYFADSAYSQVMQDSPPQSGWNVVVFFRQDGHLEISLMSRQAQGHYYDFAWHPNDINSNRMLPCFADGRPMTQANLATALDGQQPCLLISCPALDERIQLYPFLLVRQDAESQRDRNIVLQPWKRLLLWLGRLQLADMPAYARVPSQLKSVLGGHQFEQNIDQLNEAQIQHWIQQQLLPGQLSTVLPEHVPTVVQTIQGLQQMAKSQPSPQGGGLLATLGASLGLSPSKPAVPALLTQVVADRLDLIDLQVMVTIGAIDEVENFGAREWRKLIARRPDLQARMQSPEGQSSVMLDPEVVALKQSPEFQKLMADQAWRATGNTGPNPMEQGEAMQRTMMMQMFFGVPIDPNALSAPKRPAWQVYTPFQT
jgi:hypothetical protein